MLVYVNEDVPMNAQVFARYDEPIDVLLKRFKRQVRNAGILEEVKDRQRFTKPSVERHKQKVRRKIITHRLQVTKKED